MIKELRLGFDNNRRFSYFANKDQYMFCFRGDCGLPMGILPASPFYKAHIRSGKPEDEAHQSCWNRNLHFWGEDGYVPDYRWDLQKVTEYNSYQNPYVSTTLSLETALRYAQKYVNEYSNPYISIFNIAPYGVPNIEQSKNWRYIEFLPWYRLGKAEFNKEIGVIGSIKKEELIAQVPINMLSQKLIENIKQGKLPIDEIINLSVNSSQLLLEYESNRLFCPNCRAKLSVYLSEVLGVPGSPNFANDISVFPSHLYENSWDFVNPYPIKTNSMSDFWNFMNSEKKSSLKTDAKYLDWYLIELTNSGLACICNNCNEVIYSPSIADRPLAKLVLLKYFDDKIDIEITNNSTTEIDDIKIALKVRYQGKIFNIVRIFHLTAFTNGVTPFDVVDGYNSLKKENETLENFINRIEGNANISVPPNSTKKLGFIFCNKERLEDELEVIDAQLFSCHFESGRDWLNLRILKEKWDFSFKDIP